MNLIEPSFDATVFAKNRLRLFGRKAGRTLFENVAYEEDRRRLKPDEHFSVDGTPIEAAESMTSFRRRDDDERITPDIRLLLADMQSGVWMRSGEI